MLVKGDWTKEIHVLLVCTQNSVASGFPCNNRKSWNCETISLIAHLGFGCHHSFTNSNLDIVTPALYVEHIPMLRALRTNAELATHLAVSSIAVELLLHLSVIDLIPVNHR